MKDLDKSLGSVPTYKKQNDMWLYARKHSYDRLK